VGAYIAAAVRCFALEEPVLPLDVNVKRVLARRYPGGVDTAGDPWRAGQALMEFGQRICTARPRCELCPVRDGCPAAAGLTGATDLTGPSGATHGSPPARRRQKPFEGSLRQRRGRLLRRVLADGAVAVGDADRDAAVGLADDGLVVLDDGWLRPPE
jgi:adenine-specific DNA glycosylase